MNMLTISCPSCGISRQVPADKVPDGARRVTCPQCKHVFQYSKPVTDSPPADCVTPPPAPEPPRQQPPPSPTPHQSRSPLPQVMATKANPVPPRGLTDIGELFKESWDIFQQRFATLIGLYLLTMVAFTLPVGITFGLAILAGVSKGGSAFLLTGAIGLLAGIYLGFRCFAAFLQAVADERLSFGEALEKGNQHIFPLIWIGFLTSFTIGGGFILLVIPGIIFMVWFFFAQFILVKEDVRGMGALLKSREYVSGEWFNVSLRLLLIWAASVLIGVIPLAGPLLCIVFFPFIMIYHYLIYRDLREMKGDVPYSCGTADVLKWPAVALAGFVIVPVALVSVLGFSLFGKLGQFKDLKQANVTVVQKSPTATKATDTSERGLRVINFPQKTAADPSSAPSGATTGESYASASPQTGSTSPLSGTEEYPDGIHVFVYAVNYTGTVRANGTVIREMEGKPDMQYSYNMNGKGLRYGQNQIDIDFAEIPNPPSTMLEVHLKVSRNAPGKGSEILGDWRFSDRGTGRKSFTFDIRK